MAEDGDDDEDKHSAGETSKKSQTRDEKLFDQWKTFRAAANDEKRWMNERFKWLSVAQPFLFAGLFLVLGDTAAGLKPHKSALLSLIAALGLFVSVVAGAGVLAAAWMHWVWFTKLREFATELNKGGELPVATFGMKPHWPSRLSTVVAPSIAAAFILCWTLIPCQIDGLNLFIVFIPSAVALLCLAAIIQYVRNDW